MHVEFTPWDWQEAAAEAKRRIEATKGSFFERNQYFPETERLDRLTHSIVSEWTVADMLGLDRVHQDGPDGGVDLHYLGQRIGVCYRDRKGGDLLRPVKLEYQVDASVLVEPSDFGPNVLHVVGGTFEFMKHVTKRMIVVMTFVFPRERLLPWREFHTELDRRAALHV